MEHRRFLFRTMAIVYGKEYEEELMSPCIITGQIH